MPQVPSELRVLVDAVIPADEFVGGWDGGVGAYLAMEWEGDVVWAHADLLALSDAFAAAGASPAPPSPSTWLQRAAESSELAKSVATLIRVCREGYYGGRASAPPAGWSMLGYRPWPFEHEPPAAAPGPTPAKEPRDHYDVVVIGSGPGGSVAASVLSRTGEQVLVIERASTLNDQDLMGDHLHGKRMATYAPTAGPGKGNPRIVLEPDGEEWETDGTDSGDMWGLNAMVAGGGTRLWQAMSWRFLPEDFRMRSDHGRPDGSSLADWPIEYTDLEPYYSRAETELGVSGAVGALTERLPGLESYAMPAMKSDRTREFLGTAAETIGWATGPIPFAINSVPRDGRPACVACHQCIGHACPVNAKNGAHNTFLTRALGTGNCDLVLDTQVVSIVMRGETAVGVHVVEQTPSGPRTRTVGCGTIVVAAGAIETPRLLLSSGLGNDHVGRHLQGHAVSLWAGLTTESVPTFSGPGHSIATFNFVHGGGAPFGGGVIFDAFSPYPLQLASWADSFGVEAVGKPSKEWMRAAVGSIVGTMTMGQEIPHPDSRVSIVRGRFDKAGMPIAKLQRAEHPATQDVRRFLSERCWEWLAAAGCTEIVDIFAPRLGGERRSPATEHSAGTARMGLSPDESATGPDGLVWGTANVFVCDGSLHPTNGSVNPTLTLIANAMRVAEGIALRL